LRCFKQGDIGYKTDKPVTKNKKRDTIKPKNGLRPKNRGKQKQKRGRGAAAEPTKSTWTWGLACWTVLPNDSPEFVWRASFLCPGDSLSG
jgi:hypothetical protein